MTSADSGTNIADTHTHTHYWSTAKKNADLRRDSAAMRKLLEATLIKAKSLCRALESGIYTFQSAAAAWSDMGDALLVNYSGAISSDACASLTRDIAGHRQRAAVSLEHIEKAITVYGTASASDRLAWPLSSPPSIVITREDQYANELAYSLLLARVGVIRLPFLQEQTPQAMAMYSRIRYDRHPA